MSKLLLMLSLIYQFNMKSEQQGFLSRPCCETTLSSSGRGKPLHLFQAVLLLLGVQKTLQGILKQYCSKPQYTKLSLCNFPLASLLPTSVLLLRLHDDSTSEGEKDYVYPSPLGLTYQYKNTFREKNIAAEMLKFCSQ